CSLPVPIAISFPWSRAAAAGLGSSSARAGVADIGANTSSGYVTARPGRPRPGDNGRRACVLTRIGAGDSGRDGAGERAAEHTDLVADLLCPVVIGRGAESDALRSAL